MDNDEIINKHKWGVESVTLISDKKAELVVTIPINQLLDEARLDQIEKDKVLQPEIIAKDLAQQAYGNGARDMQDKIIKMLEIEAKAHRIDFATAIRCCIKNIKEMRK